MDAVARIADRSSFDQRVAAWPRNVDFQLAPLIARGLAALGLKCFRLRPSEHAQARGFVRIRLDGAVDERLVPVGAGLDFLLRVRGEAAVSIIAGDGRIEPVGWREAIGAGLRRRFTRLRRGVLTYDDVEIFPDGPKRRTKPYCKHVRHLRGVGAPPDGALMRSHPELIRGWPRARERAAVSAAAATPRVAVALHLHYIDLWDEIETLLARWTFPFTLFVTLTADDPAFAEKVRAAFPGAVTRVVDNRGRDVRPFLLLLEDDALDRFDLVCKIHGKKSLGVRRLPIFGDIMRRTMFLDLIAGDAEARKIVAMFADDPQIGVIGAARFRLAAGAEPLSALLGRNRLVAEAIVASMQKPIGDEFDFFEGTMFWARPRALAPLTRLGLSRQFLPVDAGLTDGALEHAIERLFNHAARVAGYRAETVGATR